MSDEPKSDAEMRTEFLIAEHERTIRELHARLADLEMVIVSARVGREWYANQASDLRAERDRLLQNATTADDAKDTEIAKQACAAADLAAETIAELRTEIAELRERPALTTDRLIAAARKTGWGTEGHDDEMASAIIAALGPVTIPSPDRAEELTAAIYGDSFSELRVTDRLSMVRRTQDALIKIGKGDKT